MQRGGVVKSHGPKNNLGEVEMENPSNCFILSTPTLLSLEEKRQAVL